MNTVGIASLLQVQGATRYARSYAFLYAAYKKIEAGQSAINDIIDCLIPFVAVYTNQSDGRQLKFQDLQVFLHTTFGFDIPIYALQQLASTLQRQGLIRFKPGPNILIAVKKGDEFFAAREEIETD